MNKQGAGNAIWADDIHVKNEGGVLVIAGSYGSSAALDDGSLWSLSVPPHRWIGNRKKSPPHVQFANARSDENLVEFVCSWGPVRTLGTPLEYNMKTRRFSIKVRQDMKALREDQQAFSSVARLVSEVQSNHPDVGAIDELCQVLDSLDSGLTGRFESPRSARVKRAKASAHFTICRRLNNFPLWLYPTRGTPVELPRFLPAVAGGVKDVLYGMLRLEYMQQRPLKGIGRCPRCGDFFAKERSGAVYCDGTCSHLHSSLKDYDDQDRNSRGKNAAS